MKKLALLTTLSILIAFRISAQSQIIIEDSQKLLHPDVREQLKAEFNKIELQLTNLVDFTNKCDYYFASVAMDEKEVHYKVKNCNDLVLGEKSMGKSILTAPKQEQVLMTYYNLKSILENPHTTPENVVVNLNKAQESSEKSENSTINMEHDSRYFFAPSAYNLKQNEFYYNTVYFTLHDIQYGLSDNFTVGLGTTFFGYPMYFTGKYSAQLVEKTNFTLGDMAIVGTYGTNFFSNLAYAGITQGSRQTNFTISVGYLTTSDNEITNKSAEPLLNISGMAQASQRVYFVTENYFFNIDSKEYDGYYDGYNWVETTYRANNKILFGMSGIRIIRKSNELASWQFGLAYIGHKQEVPVQHQNDYYTDDPMFFTFPMFSYTQKFRLD